jgi:hypothetical protein
VITTPPLETVSGPSEMRDGNSPRVDVVFGSFI